MKQAIITITEKGGDEENLNVGLSIQFLPQLDEESEVHQAAWKIFQHAKTLNEE